MTMRELWWAACGRLDVDVMARVFWQGVFGEKVRPEKVDDLHPLRRLEKPPHDPAELEEARQVGWDAFEMGLAEMNRKRE